MLGEDMESCLDWLRSSLESMCIRISFLLLSHLVVQHCRHAALQVCVCPSYHGNRFRHCRPTADLNRRSRENQIRFGNFCKKKRLTTVPLACYSHTLLFISFQILRLIFTQLTRGPETLIAMLNFPLRAAHFGSNSCSLSFSSVTVFHPRITILWPRLCRITILQEIQHQTLSQDRQCDTLLCCVLQAAVFPAQHLSVEFSGDSALALIPASLTLTLIHIYWFSQAFPAKRHIILKLAEIHLPDSLWAFIRSGR